MRLHGCSYVEFGWINTWKKKHCEWTTFHGRNKIYMIFLGTLFHSKISWIFMDGLLFHQKGFDSTTFNKVDTKETWNLNSKPFNLLSICFKDVLEGTLNFERALLKLQKAIWWKKKKLREREGKKEEGKGEKVCTNQKKKKASNNPKFYKIVGNFKLIHEVHKVKCTWQCCLGDLNLATWECGHDRLLKPTWQTSQISKY